MLSFNYSFVNSLYSNQEAGLYNLMRYNWYGFYNLAIELLDISMQSRTDPVKALEAIFAFTTRVFF